MLKGYLNYLIDGAEVVCRRKIIGLSQLALARACRITSATLRKIERSEGVYGYDTISVLARKLDCHIDDLLYAREIFWRATPPTLDRAERALVTEAMNLDMRRHHLDAAAKLRQVLDILPYERDRDCFTAIEVRRIALLYRGGDVDTAMQECERLLDRLPAEDIGMIRWTRYHQAICLRLRGAYDEALEIFEPMLHVKDRSYRSSAHHQIGVVFIQLAKRNPLERSAYLARAIDHLEQALEIFETIGNRLKTVPYRCGYTLHRLAEAHDLAGDFDAAIEYCIDALVLLASDHCTRYVEDARRDLHALIRKKNLVCAGGQQGADHEGAAE